MTVFDGAAFVLGALVEANTIALAAPNAADRNDFLIWLELLLLEPDPAVRGLAVERLLLESAVIDDVFVDTDAQRAEADAAQRAEADAAQRAEADAARRAEAGFC